MCKHARHPKSRSTVPAYNIFTARCTAVVIQETKLMPSCTRENSTMYGWCGTILHVDLSSSTITEEELPRTLAEKFIGGAGINARLLYDCMRNSPRRDALAPESPIIFGCGPMVGTRFPCASRFTVTAKSPLTGIFGDTNAGGWFPVRLKQAGYDHIVIRGKAPHPVALLIERNAPPQIVDARSWWGLDIYETDQRIREQYGNCETARIGPAGEHLVRYASILSGHKRISSNGRTGMGCVMGSKNLKAVIIKVKKTHTVPVADEEAVANLAGRYREAWHKGPGTTLKRQYGTLTLMAQKGEAEMVKNEQAHITPEQLDCYDLELFTNNFKTGQTACYRCPVACSQQWEIRSGDYAGESGDKVEYGHMSSLGPLIGVFDFAAMLHLSDVCNRMGMDCIQFGYNAAMAMECFQRGIIGTEETGGMKLLWGDDHTIAHLMELTALRSGFGDLLAESAPVMASRLGPDAASCCSHIKGMSFPYSCTFGLPMSLASAVATRGGDHLKGHPFAAIIGHEEMLEKMFGTGLPEQILDHTSPVAKGRVVWWQENYKMIMDCLGLCFLPIINSNVWSDPLILIREMGEMYGAITGCDPEGLFESAERAYQIERCFNTLLGLSRKDDVKQGTLRGEQDPINLPGMLEEYYRYRGCSQEGLPTRKRLSEIGLSGVAQDLEKNRKLSESECPSIAELLQHAGDVRR